MPQQINLYIPVLLTQQRYFSALVMVQALLALIALGALLVFYEVTSLHRQNSTLRQTLSAQATALEGMHTAARLKQATTVPVELGLAQDLEARRADLQRVERMLVELQPGVFRPGEGHSARLALVARSIPATAWVTLVRADAARFEVSGFTFEPATLNTWINQLGASPLLTGQRLATVAVAKVAGPAGGTRPVWSFNLVNARDQLVSGERR